MNNSLLTHIPYRHTSGTKYVHRLFLISLLILFVSTLRAQTPNWAWGMQIHGNQSDPALFLDTDHSGNILIAGAFNSLALEIEDTILMNEPYVWPFDAYIAINNGDGNLRWAKRLHAEKNDDPQLLTLNAAIFDAEGDVYMLGESNGWIQINDDLIGLDDGGSFTFLIELSPEGNLKWYKLFDYGIETYDLLSDEYGGVYLSGIIASYLDEYDFGGTVVETTDYNGVAFLAHYNQAYIADWVTLLDDYMSNIHFYSNQEGSLFITGSFYIDEIVLDTFHLYRSEKSYSDNFAGKFNGDGAVTWAKVMSSQDESICSSAAYKDELYLLGSFNDDYVVFSNDTIFSNASSTTFLLHITDTGEIVATHTLDEYQDCDDVTIAVSPQGVLHVGKYVLDSLWTGSEMLYEQEPYADPAVIRYNEMLEPQSGFSIPMYGLTKEPELDWDAFGNLILLGALYGDTLVFGEDTLINIQLSTQPDPIIARSLDCSDVLISIKNVDGVLYAPTGVAYQWYCNGVPLVDANAAFLLPQQSGDYTVRVELENGCFIWSRATVVELPDPEELSISVFPNPTQNLVNIVVPAFADQCVIYDVLGRKLIQWEHIENLNATVNISTSGIYFAEVRYNDKSRTIKFVVL